MDKIKIDYVKLTPDELQGLDGFLGEIPTKYGLPILNLINVATKRRLDELEAEQKAEEEATEEFMTPKPTI